MSKPPTTEGFAALYDEHHHRVYAYVVSRAGRQIADEIVSDTFLVAWRRWADLPAAPLPWLLGVVRNVVREQARAASRQESLAAELRDWISAAELTVDDIADGVVERAATLRALATLPDDDQDLLLLTAWHGLTSHEAARVVGCSRPAYFVRLHRARRRMTQALAAGEEPGRHGTTMPLTLREEPTR